MKNVVDNSTLTAQTIHLGDVYNNSGHQTPPILTAPTASVPASFLGRIQELEDIRRLLCGKSTLALVNAEGGMGKTTLAAAYWDKYRSNYKHLAWLFCEKGILQAVRNQFPEPLGLKESMNQYADDAPQQIAVIKNHLANLPKDCLLVLDNANEPEHIHGFMEHMSGLGWHVLLTSRCSKVIDRQNEYAITSLPPDLARQLFTDNYSEDTAAFAALLDRFLAAVGYNTLCIEIFSKNLREANPWGYTFSEFLGRLEKGGLFLGENSFAISTDYSRNVRKNTRKSDEILAALYPFASLDEKDTDLLIRFALLPAESHAAALLAELLPADSKPALKHHLDSLAQRGWLATDTVSYRISPVMQKIVLQKHADRRWEVAKPMVARLHDIFETQGFHSVNIKTAPPFAALISGFVENLDAANEDIIMLFDRLWIFYTATGDLVKALEIAERLGNVSEKLQDKNCLAISCQYLGITQAALGNLEEALKFYEAYNFVMKELHEGFPMIMEFKNGLGVSYEYLGNTQATLGNLDKALAYYAASTHLIKELHDAYPTNAEFKNGLAVSYQYLGNTQTALGNLGKAFEYYEAYYLLVKELHDTFPTNMDFKHGLAISCQYLGNTYSALGNLDKTLAYYEAYNLLEKELHNAYPTNVGFKDGLAASYSKLGETQFAIGNFGKALEYYEACNLLGKELHNAYPTNMSFKKGLAISYQLLGETQTAIGNLGKALAYYESYNFLEKELYDTYSTIMDFKKGLAFSYSKLGETQAGLGNLDKAFEYYEASNFLIKEIYNTYPTNVDFKKGLAASYAQLGCIYRDNKRYSVKAKGYLQESYKLFKELSESFPAYVEFRKNYEWVKRTLGE